MMDADKYVDVSRNIFRSTVWNVSSTGRNVHSMGWNIRSGRWNRKLVAIPRHIIPAISSARPA